MVGGTFQRIGQLLPARWARRCNEVAPHIFSNQNRLRQPGQPELPRRRRRTIRPLDWMVAGYTSILTIFWIRKNPTIIMPKPTMGNMRTNPGSKKGSK